MGKLFIITLGIFFLYKGGECQGPGEFLCDQCFYLDPHPGAPPELVEALGMFLADPLCKDDTYGNTMVTPCTSVCLEYKATLRIGLGQMTEEEMENHGALVDIGIRSCDVSFLLTQLGCYSFGDFLDTINMDTAGSYLYIIAQYGFSVNLPALDSGFFCFCQGDRCNTPQDVVNLAPAVKPTMCHQCAYLGYETTDPLASAILGTFLSMEECSETAFGNQNFISCGTFACGKIIVPLRVELKNNFFGFVVSVDLQLVVRDCFVGVTGEGCYLFSDMPPSEYGPFLDSLAMMFDEKGFKTRFGDLTQASICFCLDDACNGEPFTFTEMQFLSVVIWDTTTVAPALETTVLPESREGTEHVEAFTRAIIREETTSAPGEEGVTDGGISSWEQGEVDWEDREENWEGEASWEIPAGNSTEATSSEENSGQEGSDAAGSGETSGDEFAPARGEDSTADGSSGESDDEGLGDYDSREETTLPPRPPPRSLEDFEDSSEGEPVIVGGAGPPEIETELELTVSVGGSETEGEPVIVGGAGPPETETELTVSVEESDSETEGKPVIVGGAGPPETELTVSVGGSDSETEEKPVIVGGAGPPETETELTVSVGGSDSETEEKPVIVGGAGPQETELTVSVGGSDSETEEKPVIVGGAGPPETELTVSVGGSQSETELHASVENSSEGEPVIVGEAGPPDTELTVSVGGSDSEGEPVIVGGAGPPETETKLTVSVDELPPQTELEISVEGEAASTSEGREAKGGSRRRRKRSLIDLIVEPEFTNLGETKDTKPAREDAGKPDKSEQNMPDNERKERKMRVDIFKALRNYSIKAGRKSLPKQQTYGRVIMPNKPKK